MIQCGICTLINVDNDVVMNMQEDNITLTILSIRVICLVIQIVIIVLYVMLISICSSMQSGNYMHCSRYSTSRWIYECYSVQCQKLYFVHSI